MPEMATKETISGSSSCQDKAMQLIVKILQS